MSNRNVIPLGFMTPGQEGTMVEIRGLRHREKYHTNNLHGHFRYQRGHKYHSDKGHRLEHRLNYLGLVPGATVKVIRNNVPGPMIIAVKGSKLCLGRGTACRVMIEPNDNPSFPAENTG